MQLQPGDRMQVREYIFQLASKERYFKNLQILECHADCWKVYHGRIVVASNDKFSELDWLPIPRTIELLQWSASTDLYSLGVLALYSVYYQQRRRTTEVGEPLEAISVSKIEDDFREMLTYLSSEPYFNTLWPDLEWLRIAIEKEVDDSGRIDKNKLRNLPFLARTSVERSERSSDISADDEEGPLTLYKAAVKLTHRITQTVPWTHHLVAALDYELGHFIFFIHFVLCCLHRRNHIKNPRDWMTELPFCESRLEKPENGAADRALARIIKIRENMLAPHGILTGLQSSATEIPEFNPQPE
jgi:hypothetical protein